MTLTHLLYTRSHYLQLYNNINNISMMADSIGAWLFLTVLISILVLMLGILFICIRLQKKRKAQRWKAAYLKTRHAVDLEAQSSISKRASPGGLHRSRPPGGVEDTISMPLAAMLRDWEEQSRCCKTQALTSDSVVCTLVVRTQEQVLNGS